MRLGQIVVLLHRLVETHSPNPSVADRHQSLMGLIGCTLGGLIDDLGADIKLCFSMP